MPDDDGSRAKARTVSAPEGLDDVTQARVKQLLEMSCPLVIAAGGGERSIVASGCDKSLERQMKSCAFALIPQHNASAVSLVRRAMATTRVMCLSWPLRVLFASAE